jgi:tetratricopeptide (TPR) repeat protein
MTTRTLPAILGPLGPLLVLCLLLCCPARAQAPAVSDLPWSEAELTERLGRRFEFGSLEQAKGAVQEATRAGQLERAREILGDLLVIEYGLQADAALAAGDPASALPLIKQSLAIRPRAPGLLRQRAEALLVLAEQTGRDGRSGAFVQSAFEDALRSFRECPDDARSLFGQSRAHWWLNRSTEALACAERGAALLRQGAPELEGLPPALPELYPFGGAQEILAQAAYLAFADAAQREIDRAPDADTERADRLYARALAESDAAASIQPQSPGTWIRIANLELFRGAARSDPTRTEAALAALSRGLRLAPDDAALLARLVEVAGQAGGPARTLAELERLSAEFPDGPRTRFELSKARFQSARATMPADGRDERASETARGLFAEARDGFLELAEAGAEGLAEPARGFAVIAQAGLGWVSFNAGDDGRAEREFLATEELMPGGLRWRWEGVIGSAEQGLALLVARMADRNDLERAAELSSALSERIPDDANYANNSGFFWRDAAVALEQQGADLCALAGGGPLIGAAGRPLEGESLERALGELRSLAGVAPELYGTEAEKRLFREAAAQRIQRARGWIERSAAGYRRAAELAQDDVRVLNDAALVLVHYLHTDLDQAEAWLERALQLGELQLAQAPLDDPQRFDLTEATGDAAYNLGILYLDHRNQPERARYYFERSLEIGPADVARIAGTREFFLPRCSGERPADPKDSVLAWGRACE